MNCSLQTSPKLHLQNLQREQGVLVSVCHPNAGELGTGEPWVFLARPPSQSVSSRVSRNPGSKNEIEGQRSSVSKSIY